MTQLDTARFYIRRGRAVVPVPHRAKAPVIKGWLDLRITEADAPRYFNGAPQNIGVILGPPSGGLVDADLDCSEALRLAAYFLPPTECVFGRASKPRSHRIYLSEVPKRLELVDPEGGECLLELRSTGCQTVFPGSTHPSGEAVGWHEDGEPGQVDAEALQSASRKLGAACLLVRAAPAEGRHEYLLDVSGALVRSLGADGTAHLLHPVAREVLGVRYNKQEGERLIADTARKLAAGEPVSGWPKLAERIGGKRARKLGEWLGLPTAAHGAEHADSILGSAAEPGDGGRTAEGDIRPLVRIRGGALDRSAAAAAKVLGDATLARPRQGVYRRGSLLVRAARIVATGELGKAGIKRARGSLAIAAVDPHYLRLRLTALARWQRFDKRSEQWVDVDAPTAVAQALIAAADTWNQLPRLSGIVESPTLRPDGTVLDNPGYDEETGLLFDPGGVEFPPVPRDPTRAEALTALDALLAVFQEFPFVDEGSRAVAVGAPVTALARKAMRAAPLHIYTAPKMASGKTLLASVASYVATGRAPAMMTQADDAESERKRLLAVLLEGAPIVVVDNVERPLKSDALCAILTEPLFSDRLLGVSQTATVPTSSTFLATGNNIVVAGDLSARAVVCELDPECERPEERRFRVDLHRRVPEHRAELAVAALTVVRAYLAAGAPCPPGLPNFARFEDWSRFVREPLVWLGMADPCETRRKIEARDPVREKLGNLLEAWAELFGGAGQTIAKAVETSRQTDALGNPHERYLGLREAMDAIAGERGRVNARRLGSFLSSHERRIERGLRFVREGGGHGGLIKGAVTP
jgi:hypothetical protein